MKKIVNFYELDLSKARNGEEFIVPARHLYVISCTGDLYAAFNDKQDELINLKDIQYIDLAGVSKIYFTNTSQNNLSAKLLFTSLLKITFK